ncbi:ribonuclease Z [Belliella kenyensis]|uniref:Ribonuclease Z n=1 Tax=Belliella kenyensis TaxID=1472724 RepID=A0ABV8EIP9_9BACT|nr:ribonuclease Z [Belliella kenyensis]MCH7400284.1 ribonuclease Z [Belliella kenyensis]MDN3604698.1 ribonuclease Z [Belliella kenyensis]MDN3605264.1 ribonuclease Z [Belliella kenyensis]
MDFTVTILGSNAAIPAHGRNQTAQLVNIGLSYLLLDCGEGTQNQLRSFKLRYSKIDYIFISHLHGDHYYGLMGLITTFHLHRRSKLLTIFGPKGLDEIITIQLKYSNTKLNYPIRFVSTDADVKALILEERNFRVYSFPLKHRIPCTGFLIQEKQGLLNMNKAKLLEKKISIEAINSLRKGIDYTDKNGDHYSVTEYTIPPAPLRSYAFCSDTIYDPIDLTANIQGVTTIYHEATFGDDEVERAVDTFHSTARQAGLIAAKINAKKLILGHFSTRYLNLAPLLEQAQASFSESVLGEEGITYPIV